MVGGPICGKPMRFYRLKRGRTDTSPACHRPPGHAGKHLSWTALQRANEYKRDWQQRRQARMSAPGDRTGT